MEKAWNGLPFNPISQFYKNKFNTKIYKIPVSIVDTCPNRMGLKGMQTCVFCDEWGSAARSDSLQMPLTEQIQKYKAHIGKRFNATKFLAYFQAYTNSFLKISTLDEHFKTVLQDSDILGFVVGTRPDCVSPAVLNLWKSYSETHFVSIELGVQSFFEDQLEFLKRGHDAAAVFKAIKNIKSHSDLDLGIHLIFGLPNETDQQIIETANICNSLGIDHVKLHHLHVLKNTELEKIWNQGEFNPIDRSTYAHRVKLFLEHLSPEIFVHRLAAFSSRWDELIVPEWTSDKMGTHQYIVDTLRAEGSYQSLRFHPTTALQIQKKSELAFQSSKRAIL